MKKYVMNPNLFPLEDFICHWMAFHFFIFLFIPKHKKEKRIKSISKFPKKQAIAFFYV